MSQHIGNNHHHHQKTKYSYTTFGSQTMSTHIYIYRNRMFVYKKYGPTGPCHIKVQQNRLTSLIKNGTPKYHTNHGASKAPPAAPPSGGGGGPPLPAPGGGGGSSARPPAQVAGDHSSSPLAPQPAAGATAMAAAIPHTAPGHPHPGSGSTNALARPAAPSRNDGLHPHPLRLPPAEHAMAPHQGHPSGASAPVSQVLLLQQLHPSDASHPALVCPAQAAPVPGPCPPLAHEVLHLHKHQTNNKQRY
jgi:hypothetical protein